MTVPKFYKFLMAVLEYLDQVEEADLSELMVHIKNKFDLSEEDMKETIPNKRKTRVYDRVTWAVTYLKKAGLVINPRRGIAKITLFGKKEFKKFRSQNITSLTPRFLKENYSSFRDFKEGKSKDEEKQTSNDNHMDSNDNETPQEKMDLAFTTINEKLKDELLEKIFEANWAFFERMVVNLLIKIGYGGSRNEAGKAFQTTKDEGIDGVIYEDKLGLDLFYIQAKRWKNQVGRPEIQKFAGALQGKKVKKGVFITTSTFSKDAREFVKGLESRIVLIDGDQLTDFMIASGTGVVKEHIYQINTVDHSYFDDVA